MTKSALQPTSPVRGVKVRWSPDLATELMEGMQLTVIGQLTLPPPLSRLLVLGRSRSPMGAVSLAAALIPTAARAALNPIGLGTLAGIKVPEELISLFQTRRHGGAVYVLDRRGKDFLVMGGGLLNQQVISCGPWPVLMPLVGPSAPARQLSNRTALEDDLTAFTQVLEVVLTGVYRAHSQALPNAELVLSPTGYNVDSALGGLRRLGRSAAELASKIPRAGTARPGKVYNTPSEAAEDRVTFDDVGGNEAAKAELEPITLSIRDPESFRRWGARPPRGVLLFGPPGTGKTLLARCLAGEADARFIHVKVTDITSKWYGEAEAKLQQAFDWARREAPAILFFDELDALARSREDAHEASHRIVSTFLENMDGLESVDGVVVLAATNRPEAVDPALTRPGRFDRLVEVPLPDAQSRKQIFEVHLRRAAGRAGRPLFETIDEAGWERLMMASEGFSGADIEESVRRTLESKVRAGVRSGQISQDELLAQTASVKKPF